VADVDAPAEREVVVRNDPDANRYVVTVAGAPAGFSEYRLRPGKVVFTHTEINDEYEGRGIGSRLARFALDDVRRQGDLVVPLCPFIAAYIARHPDYLDLVEPSYRDRLPAAQ
jgi:predicted GNAT family acetyltransferase